ncbi:MAG: Gfo/Idh/MocA family oxidoreductase [Natrialbaceae archaeon]|nr:Gfo/Idh/MocA family oxidoreductase [Natrialbaceae archaeon]
MTGPATKTTERLAAGVVGVGAMGDNHARVYSELPSVSLAGVCDVDRGRAETVAESYGTSAHTRSDLLSRCDLVSVAVPTAQHVEVVADCLEAGVHVLVEKPLAQSLEKGRSLAKQASDSGLVLQVGHVERFNPAVETLAEYLDGLDVVAVDAQRLGPPVERTDTNGVTIDLMIHDVDVITSLLEATPGTISGAVTRDRRYATASLEFDSGVIATLTASRLTKRKVRRLAVTARECYIEVDYLDQSVTVHRDSYPEYISDDGRSRFRYESVIERPRVPTEEPLRRELAAFISAVKRGEPPVVSAEDGLDALAIVRRIDETAGIVGGTL